MHDAVSGLTTRAPRPGHQPCRREGEVWSSVIIVGVAVASCVQDVWEHAYYLDVQNRRPDYMTTYFDLINWDKVAERYEAAL